MLLTLGMLFAMQGGVSDDNNPAADWACATPYIERNYRQKVDPRQLALRITDECAVPYRASLATSKADETIQMLEQRTHMTNREIFALDIERRIQVLRRKDAIKLN